MGWSEEWGMLDVVRERFEWVCVQLGHERIRAPCGDCGIWWIHFMKNIIGHIRQDYYRLR